MADKNNNDLARLPEHFFARVFALLDVADVLRCECVCRAFATLVNSTSFIGALAKRLLGGLNIASDIGFQPPSPLDATDRLIIGALRSLADADEREHKSASPLDHLLVLWFKVTLWTGEPSPAYGRVQSEHADTRDDPPSIPKSGTVFWSKLFAALPRLHDVLMANVVDYGVYDSRQRAYTDITVGELDHERLLGSAPDDVRATFFADEPARRMRVEMVIASRRSTFNDDGRYAIAILTFHDRTWATVCVELRRGGGHCSCDHGWIVDWGSSPLAWCRRLVSVTAGPEEIRSATEPVFDAFVAELEREPAPYMFDVATALQLYAKNVQNFTLPYTAQGCTRRRSVAVLATFMGGKDQMHSYNELRKEAIADVERYITSAAKRISAKLERGKSIADVGRLKVFADSLVERCEIEHGDRSSKCGLSKPLWVVLERAIRRLTNKLVVDRLKDVLRLERTEKPLLADLAFCDYSASATLLRVYCQPQWDQERALCVHNAVPAIWPLSVARTALSVARFAAQLVTFEVLAFERSGCAAAAYSRAHIERIERLAERFGVVFDRDEEASSKGRMCERCRSQY